MVVPVLPEHTDCYCLCFHNLVSSYHICCCSNFYVQRNVPELFFSRTYNCDIDCLLQEEAYFPLRDDYMFLDAVPIEERVRGSMPPSSKEECEVCWYQSAALCLFAVPSVFHVAL